MGQTIKKQCSNKHRSQDNGYLKVGREGDVMGDFKVNDNDLFLTAADRYTGGLCIVTIYPFMCFIDKKRLSILY